ncbi:Protein of unknown function [Streptomyces zhaozhouensis]|uniref:DUF4232 domain-containing protein n=1 Tax=Streptomyces zhaozhouensis TaxID=1300267 RepID=A0A286DZF0_9ACTN|nr:DUF4232 domain-containing protein [Streptomyces zhaozhouensis]SOD64049.1 Protein of unknown function [Streptomyces zhaozhouensis]
MTPRSPSPLPRSLSRRSPSRAAPRLPLALGAALAATGLLLTGCSGSEDSEDDAAQREASTPDERSDPRPQAGSEDADAPDDEGAAPPPAEDDGATDAEDTANAANAADWCATDALSATVTPLDSGAGNRHATLVLTNTSDTDCRTQGWPGLELAADDGSLPTTTVRDTSREADQLTLAPGESAWSQLRWTVVPGEEDPADGSCGPEPTTLRVIPPDTREATEADWQWGEVCGDGRIEARALAAGEGP